MPINRPFLKNRIQNGVLPLLLNHGKFELSSQILRSTRSVTTNIAEGWGRFHFLVSSQARSTSQSTMQNTIKREKQL
ncbi:four helix bundle protein [Algoriphagus resistens]|uniref:four helix bundle protein n=1 Tax=Algoriphagus resistens TaxID=1750590 RepID=UPI0009E75CEF|nr:four helix bundle protein [Algoriphagus resistens]